MLFYTADLWYTPHALYHVLRLLPYGQVLRDPLEALPSECHTFSKINGGENEVRGTRAHHPLVTMVGGRNVCMGVTGEGP